MAFVARCFSLAFSSLFLHVLTHGFDFVCSWLCVIFQVFSLYWRLHMTSPGLNLPFAGVVSITISDSVSPWHLCVVTAQPSVNGNWVLVAWNDVFFINRKCCLCSMYWNSILMYTVINTCIPCFLSNMFTIKSY